PVAIPAIAEVLIHHVSPFQENPLCCRAFSQVERPDALRRTESKVATNVPGEDPEKAARRRFSGPKTWIGNDPDPTERGEVADGYNRRR
ncbi:MAG: hypothetical protein ABR610_09205, partial [Thermoanaerobaculia bacterium]